MKTTFALKINNSFPLVSRQTNRLSTSVEQLQLNFKNNKRKRKMHTWIRIIEPFLVDLLVLFRARTDWTRINLHYFLDNPRLTASSMVMQKWFQNTKLIRRLSLSRRTITLSVPCFFFIGFLLTGNRVLRSTEMEGKRNCWKPNTWPKQNC